MLMTKVEAAALWLISEVWARPDVKSMLNSKTPSSPKVVVELSEKSGVVLAESVF